MLWAVVLSGLVISADGPQPERLEVLGIYGSPAAFWSRGGRLSDLGVNAVFAHHGLRAEQSARAHGEGAWVFAEFGVFRNRRLAKERPELVEALMPKLDEWRASDLGFDVEVEPMEEITPASDTEEQLRALGYLN